MFHFSLKAEYLRRNPSKGNKILRCFPSCSPKGHINNGFCGIPVEITLTGLKSDHVFAIVAPENDNNDILTVGSIVPSILVRCLDNPFNEAIRGRCNDEGICTFNDELFSWNYNWTSHKNKSALKHCLYIIAAINDNDGILIIQVHKSSPFGIFSRKRPGSSCSVTLGENTSGENLDSRALDRLFLLAMGPPCREENQTFMPTSKLNQNEMLSNNIQNTLTNAEFVNADSLAASIMNILGHAVFFFRNNQKIEDWFRINKFKLDELN